jgi:hypothetical protein
VQYSQQFVSRLAGYYILGIRAMSSQSCITFGAMLYGFQVSGQSSGDAGSRLYILASLQVSGVRFGHEMGGDALK